MSKLAELLTEVAKLSKQKQPACDLEILSDGRMILMKDLDLRIQAKDKSELIAKLSEYLAKEKNQ